MTLGLLRLWWKPLALVLVLTLGAGRLSAWAWDRGYRAAEARQTAALATAQERLARAADSLSRNEASRLAAEAERDALASELEDAARADGAADRAALGADSVRRLNRR